MKTKLFIPAVIALVIILVSGLYVAGQSIPKHPRDLAFSPLQYSPPDPEEHRHVFENGVVAYFVEDHELPLVTVAVLIRVGDYLEPVGKTGLAQLTGRVLRTGGAGELAAEGFDEEADFLAANISSSIGGTSGRASVNALSKDLDKALDLFFPMLREPRFQEDRLELAKSQILQQLERRNDRTNGIESREWTRLLRGENHFSTSQMTSESVGSIQREDLVSFHKEFFHPDNFVLAVSGDFKTDELKAELASRMSGWEGRGRSAKVPAPDHELKPGVYFVNKSDVNQGRVSIGHLGIQLGNPDEYAVDLMNDILGGSGFTSRITARVRSDEGLAYSAGSRLSTGTHYPGIFRAFFQSKSETCAKAAQIILDEINRIRSEDVSEQELETVKTSAIETFPRRFASATVVANTFAGTELSGRDRNFFQTYRDRVREVTVADVRRVAEKYLHPDQLVILAVGNVEDMLKGSPDEPQYSFESIAGGSEIVRIPLPDPVTMIYPEK